jgi:hypothetical protein
MSRRAIVLALALLGAFVTAAPASEGSFVWRTVGLLGGNEREHLYLVSRHGRHTGFGLTDSIFVYERSNSDAHWVQRTVIRVTVRREPTDPDTTDIEAFTANFDLSSFMADHNCHPPFFVDWPESVAVDAKGMYCHSRGARAYFLTRQEMVPWLDYDLDNLDSRGKDLRAVDLYRTTAKEEGGALTDFIVVRAGVAGSDAGEYEAIVPVADQALQTAAQQVKKKAPAHKKPAAAHP